MKVKVLAASPTKKNSEIFKISEFSLFLPPLPMDRILPVPREQGVRFGLNTK